jgi:hypothetical protein
MAPRKPPLGVWLYGMWIAEIAPKGRSYDSRGNMTAIGSESYGYDGADRHLSTSNGTTTSTFVRDLTGAVVEYRLNGVIQNRYSGSVTLDATGTGVVERSKLHPSEALVKLLLDHGADPCASAASRQANGIWPPKRPNGSLRSLPNDLPEPTSVTFLSCAGSSPS